MHPCEPQAIFMVHSANQFHQYQDSRFIYGIMPSPSPSPPTPHAKPPAILAPVRFPTRRAREPLRAPVEAVEGEPFEVGRPVERLLPSAGGLETVVEWWPPTRWSGWTGRPETGWMQKRSAEERSGNSRDAAWTAGFLGTALVGDRAVLFLVTL